MSQHASDQPTPLKRFEPGQRVRVLAGRHAGRTGVVDPVWMMSSQLAWVLMDGTKAPGSERFIGDDPRREWVYMIPRDCEAAT
jgi:hypothetical protein